MPGHVLLTWCRCTWKVSEPRKLKIFLDTRKNISVKNNISPEKKGKGSDRGANRTYSVPGGCTATVLQALCRQSDLYSIPPAQLQAVEAGDSYAEVVCHQP